MLNVDRLHDLSQFNGLETSDERIVSGHFKINTDYSKQMKLAVTISFRERAKSRLGLERKFCYSRIFATWEHFTLSESKINTKTKFVHFAKINFTCFVTFFRKRWEIKN
jgi:hypothetical protein